jgi:hypothetical protein
MRRLARDIGDGRELGGVSTLGDPSVAVTRQRTAADASERWGCAYQTDRSCIESPWTIR